MTLRERYLFIKHFEEACKEQGVCNKKEIDAILKDERKSIRRIYKNWLEYKDEEPEWRCRYNEDDWGSRFCRLDYDWVFSPEEVDEYREEEWWHWYNPWNDGRDCTGVWFTQFMYIFPLPKVGKTVVYHFQGCDI